MKIKYFAYIRDYTRCKEENFRNCDTIRELLIALSDNYGSKFHNKAFNGDKLGDEIIILVNGRNIIHLKGIETKLKNTDEISIFPVVAGG